MSDNTTLNLGIGGDIIATEDPGLGYKIPVSKIRVGGTDIDGGDVTILNPFPVASFQNANGLIIPMTTNILGRDAINASTFSDEYGNYILPSTQYINNRHVVCVIDDTNRLYNETQNIILQALLDGQPPTNPVITSSIPTIIDLGMVVRNIPSGIQQVSNPTAASFLTTVSQATAANLQMTATQGTAAAVAGAWTAKITDGANIAAVKAASTAPLATDPAAVFTISPNTFSLVGIAPKTNPIPIASVDITNTIASISSVLLNNQSRLQVNDDSLRLILEQMLLVLVDMRIIMAATTLKGETVSLLSMDQYNDN